MPAFGVAAASSLRAAEVVEVTEHAGSSPEADIAAVNTLRERELAAAEAGDVATLRRS